MAQLNSTTVHGKLVITDDTRISGDLTASGTLTANDNLQVSGNSTITGTLAANGGMVVKEGTSLLLQDSNTPGNEAKLLVGNDAYIHDCDIEFCIGINGQGNDNGKGGIIFGNNTSKGYLKFDGNFFNFGAYIQAPSFTATSDVRLKENLIVFKPEKSILDLPIYKFDFIAGTRNNIGCLAQDLQEICPEIVHGGTDGYLSIEESKLVYLLLDEVKKLKAEVEELKNK